MKKIFKKDFKKDALNFEMKLTKVIWIVQLPEQFLVISSDLFCESVIIPSSVTEIKRCAFQNWTSLKTIEIPSSVIIISTYAFCEGIVKIKNQVVSYLNRIL